MTLSFDVDWLAVLIAVVACSVLGGVWFGVVVAEPYAAAMGRADQPAWSPPPAAFAGQILATLLNVLAAAVLLRTLGVDEVGPALVFGLVAGVGYLVATVLNIAINPNFPHPIRYTLLNGPYFLVCSLITSTVVALLA